MLAVCPPFRDSGSFPDPKRFSSPLRRRCAGCAARARRCKPKTATALHPASVSWQRRHGCVFSAHHWSSLKTDDGDISLFFCAVEIVYSKNSMKKERIKLTKSNSSMLLGFPDRNTSPRPQERRGGWQSPWGPWELRRAASLVPFPHEGAWVQVTHLPSPDHIFLRTDQRLQGKKNLPYVYPSLKTVP